MATIIDITGAVEQKSFSTGHAFWRRRSARLIGGLWRKPLPITTSTRLGYATLFLRIPETRLPLALAIIGTSHGIRATEHGTITMLAVERRNHAGVVTQP